MWEVKTDGRCNPAKSFDNNDGNNERNYGTGYRTNGDLKEYPQSVKIKLISFIIFH